MTKPKQTADRRTGSKHHHYRFDRDFVDELKKRFEISRDFELYEKLNHAARLYSSMLQATMLDPRPSEEVEALDGVAHCTGELADRIERLGLKVSNRLRDVGDETKYEFLRRVIHDLRALQSQAAEASARIPADKGGRRPDVPFKGLLRELGDIFAEATGEEFPLKYDPKDQRYRRRIFRFVRECTNALGEKGGAEALAKALKLAMQE